MDIDIKKINNYIFSKHNIIPGTQLKEISDISRNHIGLHSARIITPYTTLCSRISDYNPQMLTDQLFISKNLIKIRCMRTTLHIVRLDIAPVVHMATLDLRLAECRLFFKRNNLSSKKVDSFEELIGSITVPTSPREIENKITTKLKISDKGSSKICAKMILKYFWEKGTLCYVNSSDNWEKENRKYALTKIFYSDINLQLFDIDKAQELLILDYISKFGPVTIKDMAWWSGLPMRIINGILDKNSYMLIKFAPKELNIDFFMTMEDYDKLLYFKEPDSEWISLLAYEDPSLKGYYQSRFRYVRQEDYNKLFNQIGEVRPSIIINGKAAGIWTWDKKDKKINTKLFRKMDKDTMKKIKCIKNEYENLLYPKDNVEGI